MCKMCRHSTHLMIGSTQFSKIICGRSTGRLHALLQCLQEPTRKSSRPTRMSHIVIGFAFAKNMFFCNFNFLQDDLRDLHDVELYKILCTRPIRMPHELHEFQQKVKFCQKLTKDCEHLVSFHGWPIKSHRIYKIQDGQIRCTRCLTRFTRSTWFLYTIFY